MSSENVVKALEKAFTKGKNNPTINPITPIEDYYTALSFTSHETFYDRWLCLGLEC